ncbi:MAG: hypothetical protein ACREIR_01500, partial [Geminicoccaceae bacterium]
MEAAMNASPDSQSQNAPIRRSRVAPILLGAGAVLGGAFALFLGFGGGAFLARFDLDRLASGSNGLELQEPAGTEAPGVASPPASVVPEADRDVATAKSGTPGQAAPGPSDPGQPTSVATSAAARPDAASETAAPAKPARPTA